MTTRTRRWIRGAFAIVAGLTLAAGTAGAQSQAVNGTIEGTNIFNIVQISSVRTGVQVDAAGNVLTPLVFGTTPSGLTSVPTSGTEFLPTGGYEQRKFQLGFKFAF
jgi:hypothetical protein